ncbi:hypothetical protein GCM10028819_07730 [Spirosoma humi]
MVDTDMGRGFERVAELILGSDPSETPAHSFSDTKISFLCVSGRWFVEHSPIRAVQFNNL